MDLINNCLPSLLIISTLTGLLTEALKNLLDALGFNYSSNVLAGISAILLTIGYCAIYVVIEKIAITPEVIAYGFALVFFAWVGAMIGFDKFIQTIKQLRG